MDSRITPNDLFFIRRKIIQKLEFAVICHRLFASTVVVGLYYCSGDGQLDNAERPLLPVYCYDYVRLHVVVYIIPFYVMFVVFPERSSGLSHSYYE